MTSQCPQCGSQHVCLSDQRSRESDERITVRPDNTGPAPGAGDLGRWTLLPHTPQ